MSAPDLSCIPFVSPNLNRFAIERGHKQGSVCKYDRF